jgi:hypothetical protein
MDLWINQQTAIFWDQLAKLAGDVILAIVKKKKIKVAIFTAMHTFACDLKWHVHIHLSDHGWLIIRPLKNGKPSDFSGKLSYLCGDITLSKCCAFVEIQHHKIWIVHFTKPHSSPWQTIAYLGRHLKRPPLPQSRLEHYDGKQVIFSYLNHRNGKISIRNLLPKFAKHTNFNNVSLKIHLF